MRPGGSCIRTVEGRHFLAHFEHILGGNMERETWKYSLNMIEEFILAGEADRALGYIECLKGVPETVVCLEDLRFPSGIKETKKKK